MGRSKFGILALLAMFLAAPGQVRAQVHAHAAVSGTARDSAHIADMADHAMSGPMDMNMMKHMRLTPTRVPTHDDTVRAEHVVAELKRALARYQDTASAVADGYRMFLPNVKNQKVYHFTNAGHAFKEAFRFDPAQPTSVLYARGADGRLQLVGAMYTMPKHASLARLDARVPLGIARWHQHVNWCVPRKGDAARWLEQENGHPRFGPESTIATKAACDAVHGDFHERLLGWMVHVNAVAGGDLATIFGDDHGAGGSSHHP